MKLKVWVLRMDRKAKKKRTWEEIAKQVVNLQGETPYWKVCRDAYMELKKPRQTLKDSYAKCGRKLVMSKSLCKWVLARMLKLRVDLCVTSKDLTQLLAREKGIAVDESTVRKVLKKAGYKYLPRTRKPKYSREQKRERHNFAKKYERKSQAELAATIHMYMDGVVFTIPPKDPTARENYCKSDISKVWRRPGEYDLPELTGYDPYSRQVPANRLVPLWGGLSAGGFAAVLWHEQRKTDGEEWSASVRKGSLFSALKAVNRGKTSGPWKVLCDNEAFLRAAPAMSAYRRYGISLLKLPARSPDLNPVEKMWGWVRKQLRDRDMRDMIAGVPVLPKTMYRARIKMLLQSQQAQNVAKNLATNFRTVCKRVVKAKGAAVKG
jgi:hypothetical protein